jgi:hypothetical protein
MMAPLNRCVWSRKTAQGPETPNAAKRSVRNGLRELRGAEGASDEGKRTVSG